MAYFEFPHTRTYDSDLGWLIKEYGELSAAYQTLVDDQASLDDRMKALEQFQQLLESGVLPDAMQESLKTWMNTNFPDLLAAYIHAGVFFGLTDAGYFVAYIPDSWSQIQFNTTEYDINLPLQPEFGHLVLSY